LSCELRPEYGCVWHGVRKIEFAIRVLVYADRQDIGRALEPIGRPPFSSMNASRTTVP
jgi:hypothetical protein